MRTYFLNIILKSISLAILMTMFPLMASASESNSSAVGYESPKDMITSRLAAHAASPVIVTAADLVTKVYGVIEPVANMDETVNHTAKAINLIPEVDGTDLWLDSDKGYQVSYSGMTPEVSAVAQFDDNTLSSFGYFFIFPYAADGRDEANRCQCNFCTSLLQEMYDMGSIVGMPVEETAGSADNASDSESLFNVLASYEGNNINLSLKELTQDDASGRFLLVVEVTPGLSNPYDSVMAQR